MRKTKKPGFAAAQRESHLTARALVNSLLPLFEPDLDFPSRPEISGHMPVAEIRHARALLVALTRESFLSRLPALAAKICATSDPEQRVLILENVLRGILREISMTIVLDCAKGGPEDEQHQ